MSEPESDQARRPRRSARSQIGDLAAGLTPDIDPAVILGGLRAADRAIQDAAGAAIRGAGDLLGDAVSSVDLGAIAGGAIEAAGQVLEASADVAGDVVGAVVDGLGDALT